MKHQCFRIEHVFWGHQITIPFQPIFWGHHNTIFFQHVFWGTVSAGKSQLHNAITWHTFYLFSCTSWLHRMHNPSACFLLPYSSFLLPSTSVLVCTVSPVLYIQYLHKNRTKIGCHRFWYWPKLVLHHSKLMQEICEIVPWFHLQCNTAFRINENHQFILPRGAHKKL
jgi:hypothetical protein